MARIAGTSPKTGFFQSKLIRKQQDLSGRGVIVPDASLNMDEVGLPEDMAWKMYAPFIAKNLITKGYTGIRSKELIEQKHALARDAMQQEIQGRPVLINRAPTLRRYNVLASYPKLVPGKALRVHEFQAPILGGDFDGDAVQVFVPVSPQAVAEAKTMTLSNMVLGDQYRKQVLVAPDQDATMGLWQATQPAQGKKRVFASKEEALAAYHRGEIALTTPVEIRK
jgi:DNA-directed RNA polymerase subunit beta'